MYKMVSVTLTMTLVVAAILTVSSSAMQRSNAQANGNFDNILEIHNTERAAVHDVPLVWSESLAADALSYLHTLVAQNEGLVMDPQPQIPHDPAKPSTQGENIAYFSRAASPDPPKAPSLERLVGSWVAEKSNYHGGPLTAADFAPGIPTEKQMGHYTAMVWKDTKQVGCAAAIVRGMTPANLHSVGSYLVCRYEPKGNYLGESPY
jgi:hypothetical protein